MICLSNEREKNRKAEYFWTLGGKTVILLFQMPQIPARMSIISGISPKPDDLEREKWAFQETHLYRYHRNKQRRMEHMATEEQSLESLVTTFLADLAHANHSPHTCRAYATDLTQLCVFHQGLIQTITADVLRTFFEMHSHLRPATRARKQATVACYLHAPPASACARNGTHQWWGEFADHSREIGA